MNAVQFIQQHGVDKAREVVEDAPDWAMSINFNNGVYYSRMEHKKGDTFLYDIKRLVESVDLVNLKGGVKKLKKEADCLFHNDVESVALRYEQAIADYESIESCKCVVTRTYENGTCNKCGMQDMDDDSHIENHVSPLCKVGVK